MQFTSLAYLGFFAAVFAVHWAVPQKARWAVCLAASAGFYALLGAPMLAVLALCIAVSYLGGLWLQRRRGRRPALALAAAAALAPRSRFVELAGAAHAPFLGHAADVAAEIGAFADNIAP